MGTLCGPGHGVSQEYVRNMSGISQEYLSHSSHQIWVSIWQVASSLSPNFCLVNSEKLKYFTLGRRTTFGQSEREHLQQIRNKHFHPIIDWALSVNKYWATFCRPIMANFSQSGIAAVEYTATNRCFYL